MSARFEFDFEWRVTLFTLLLLPLMVSLGFWQLDRAEFKDTLQQKIEDRKNLAAAGLDEMPDSADDRRYLPVKIIGNYDTQRSFLLDNKTFKGRVGYHVFTPMRISNSESDVPEAILVARGFVAMGRLREQLPEIETPAETIELDGILDLPPSRTLLLAEYVQQTDQWPLVLQYIDISEISKILGYPLYDMVLWLDDETADNNVGNLEYDLPVLNLNAAKNNGYAFQWFAMSLALFIIYIIVNIKRSIQ